MPKEYFTGLCPGGSPLSNIIQILEASNWGSRSANCLCSRVRLIVSHFTFAILNPIISYPLNKVPNKHTYFVEYSRKDSSKRQYIRGKDKNLVQLQDSAYNGEFLFGPKSNFLLKEVRLLYHTFVLVLDPWLDGFPVETFTGLWNCHGNDFHALCWEVLFWKFVWFQLQYWGCLPHFQGRGQN